MASTTTDCDVESTVSSDALFVGAFDVGACVGTCVGAPVGAGVCCAGGGGDNWGVRVSHRRINSLRNIAHSADRQPDSRGLTNLASAPSSECLRMSPMWGPTSTHQCSLYSARDRAMSLLPLRSSPSSSTRGPQCCRIPRNPTERQSCTRTALRRN